MEQITVLLKKFNMNQVKTHPLIVIIGSSASDNAAVVLDYLYHHQMSRTVVISSNPVYQTHIQPNYIHQEYTSDLVSCILKEQINLCHDSHVTNSVDPQTIFILDTFANSNELCQNRDLKWIFVNGRCTRLTFLWTIQKYQRMSPAFRCNTDYIFIGQQTNVDDLRLIYDAYGGMFTCFGAFHKVYEHCTKDHGYLVINNDSSDLLENLIFWYRSNTDQKEK